ncbi:hypothetical protein V7148_11360 [Gottfriedia acidiceleris]|uniref:hypothetical protein n=1 Tax=Gottfriedia acidiceleris TaxID=371036 RepID=UPI002FFED0A5
MSISEIMEKVDSALPGELFPHVGSLFQFHKNKQFKKRISDNEEKLNKVLKSITESDYDFFVGKIGTLVFEKIFLDEQDDKAEFLVLGFENCVKNNLKEEDKIINYFDIISELRMIDIKRLIYIYEYLEKKNPKDIFPVESRPHIRYVDQKLVRMGLIKIPIYETIEVDTDIEKAAIMQIGIEILDFIGYEDK